MKTSVKSFIPALVGLFLAAATASSPAQTLQCVDTNVIKVFWPPNVNGGLDVKDSRDGIVLADDFPCTQTGPITDIHLWGSWLSDTHGTITNFWLGIYNDVPAVTNFASNQITPSHPGTNLLWQQSFGPGQYAESTYGPPGTEYFYSPTNNSIVGGDVQAWYYCFYPTIPFVQQGTAAQPTNYWLACRAQILDPATLFGWKTSLVPYNDAAVWGTVDATGFPSGNWQSMTNPIAAGNGPQQIDLSFALESPANPPPTCCPETNNVKWLQRPDLVNGFDVVADTVQSVADDFPCTNTGPITDIHIWGAWDLDRQCSPATVTFTLTIWSDVPANPFTGAYSHPGINLWSEDFNPGDYVMCQYATKIENFYYWCGDYADGLCSFNQSTNLFYFCFYPTNPFVQLGSPSAPTNYWLEVSANESCNPGFGWKSSADSYNDGAVVEFSGTWLELTNPVTKGPINFAFKINTATSNPPPVACVESDYEKYLQGPNTLGGFDVWNTPYVLADDFVCTNTGPVSDIHLWGSWLGDQALTNNITFWLGIYDDVPANPPNNNYSHPSTNLLWQQWFTPGQYAEQVWTANASEQFLDPGPTNILGTDSVVWYYCFYPTNAFEQTGTPANKKTYWLAAYAQLPAGIPYQYGWKTTTNVQHDISVHAPWPGVPPINNPGWTPTSYQPPVGGPPVPLDLAFKLTMCGPVTIHQSLSTNVVLTWPGSGFLQSATNVIGPYTDVPGFPPSPYTDSSTIPPTNRFYRLRCY